MVVNTRIIAIIGTCDTKLDELLYLHDYIDLISDNLGSPLHSIKPILVDIGKSPLQGDSSKITTSISSLLPPDMTFKDRNDLIPTIGKMLRSYLLQLVNTDELHGVIAIGGSCGSSIVAEALQSLPFGFPKILLSTMASGDIKPYVGCSDISVMYSVVDIAGLNTLLEGVLQNAAGAIVGMVTSKALSSPAPEAKSARGKKKVAMTMFGITTPACEAARKVLEGNDCEVYVFHATGSGGMAMEKLILERAFDGVLDLTTTELADEAFGGVLSAGSERLKGAVKTGTPTIISLGALDCINFGPRDTLPEKFEDRNVYIHNKAVTLVRTNEEENRHLGKVICERIIDNLVEGNEEKVEVWMPLKSVSIIDQDGMVFKDESADSALHRAIRAGLINTPIALRELDLNINDNGFAERLAKALLELMRHKTGRI
ncbi:hypothetical protein ABW19_dt0207915 [Dactylella cylindrospora]|nr:hypothetical protein ABW19_dt0207915 [Dactylella cylindrospora]